MADHDFQFLIPVVKTVVGDDSGKLYIEGVAADTSIDSDRDRMTIAALDSMVSTIAKAANPIPITRDHGTGGVAELDDVIGQVVDARRDGTQLVVKAELYPTSDTAKTMFEHIKRGGKAGFSVGGRARTIYGTGGARFEFQDMALDHIVLTRKPANKNTFAMAVAKTLSEIESGDSVMEETIENKDVTPVETTVEAEVQPTEVAKTEETVTPEATATEEEVVVEKVGAKFSEESLGVIRDAIASSDLNDIKGKLRALIGEQEPEVASTADDNDGDNDNGEPIGIVEKTEEAPATITLTPEQFADLKATLVKEALVEVAKTAKVDAKSVSTPVAKTEFTLATATPEQLHQLWQAAIGKVQ